MRIGINLANKNARKLFSRLRISKGVFVTVLFLILVSIPAFLSYSVLSELNAELVVYYSLFLVPLLIYFYLMNKYEQSPWAIFEDPERDYSTIWLFIPLIAFSIGVIWVTIVLLNSISPAVAGSYLDFMYSMELFAISEETTFLQYLLIFVMISFLGPLVEEIIFRGVLIERFGLKYGYTKAVFISSILFGILHVDIIGAFLFGLVLSLIYLKTKSLLLPFLIHAANNAVATVMYFVTEKFEVESWETVEPYLEHMWFGFLIFAAAALWLAWYIKENWHIISDRQPFSAKDEAVQPED